MHITLRQLQIFEAVSRYRNFSQAAKTIHLTQPGVTKQIKSLEAQLDVKLFERSGHQLELTQAGMTLLEQGYNVFAAVNTLEQEMRQYSTNVSGSLHLSVSNVLKTLIFEKCFEFKKLRPDIEISFNVSERHNQLKHLEDNNFDLVVMSDNADVTNVNSVKIYDEPLEFLVHPEHPLLAEAPVNFKQLEEESFLIGDYDSMHRRALEELVMQYDISAPKFVHIGHTEAVAQAVVSGIAIGYLTKDIVRYELKAGAIKVLPVMNMDYRVRIYAYHLKNRVLSDSAREFIDFITGKPIESKD